MRFLGARSRVNDSHRQGVEELSSALSSAERLRRQGIETEIDLGIGIPGAIVPGPVAAEDVPKPDGPGIGILDEDLSPDTVRELLYDVIDPELGVNIVDLGLLRDVAVSEGSARVRFTVTTPACPLSEYIEDEIRGCLMQLPGLRDLDVACVMEPPWSPEEMTDAAKEALGWVP